MPLGIRQSGTETVYIKDDAGENQLVKFTYVDEIAVDIEVNCQVTSEFDKNGTDDIKLSIEAYINSLTIGDDLIWSRLYGCIYAVDGVSGTESITINGDTADIQASDTDVIRCKTIKVTVTEG